MTSNAIEFIRSGRFRVTNATCGRGRSTRTKEFCSVTRWTRARAPSRLLLLGATLSGDRGVHVELLDLVDQLVELSRGQHARMPEHHLTLLEGHQGGDRLNLSGGSEALLGFGVLLRVQHVGVLL